MDALRPDDPERIGPFTTLARIGAGGMGRVYLARSRGGRPVAVKVIRAEYADDERFRTRFRREVDAARTVDGMYTAPVLDAGPDDPDPWLATAYIPGPSLQRVVHDYGPLPERSARILGAGVAEALGAIHSAGLVHRDLKPSNVICGPDGPRVIDFGISHAVGGTSLTATGVVVGSPRYASPEQCRVDAEASPASDVFALGGVLVYAATGIPPFGEGPDHVQLYLVVHEQPDLAAVPAPLRPIIAACLEKDPANRPTIDQLLDTLLPPDAGPSAAAVDWLPDAVHRELGNYAAAPSAGGIGGMGMGGGERPTPGSQMYAQAGPGFAPSTHERPAFDPVGAPGGSSPGSNHGRNHGPNHGTHHSSNHGSDFTGGPPTAGSTMAPGVPPTPPPVPPDQGSNPTRRRLLTGAAGLAAMAVSGGGAWYAATRHGKKTATQDTGPVAATSAPGGQNPPAGSATPPASATGSSAHATPAPTPPHATGKWGEDWKVETDLNHGGGAVVRQGRLYGVYTAQSGGPNPQQSLVALNTMTGENIFHPANVPGVDIGTGASIAVDDRYIYTYGKGTVYAWDLTDGQQAWSKGGVLQPSTETNGMPMAGILGMIGSTLIIGVSVADPTNPPSLAGFDVGGQTRLWVHKPADLLASLPADMTKDGQTSIAITVPAKGDRFYVTVSDQTSVRLLKAFDPKTGRELWHAAFAHRTENGAGTMNPTVTGTEDHVYLTDMHSGSIHAYDTGGTWKWTYPSPDSPDHVTVAPEQRFTGPVVQADGVVYATNARSVLALQASPAATTGSLVWPSAKQFNGIGGAPVLAGDHIWVEVDTPSNSTGGMALTVLNRADGKMVTQYSMPAGPTGSSVDMIVADPDTPAVYVLTASGIVLGFHRQQ